MVDCGGFCLFLFAVFVWVFVWFIFLFVSGTTASLIAELREVKFPLMISR